MTSLGTHAGYVLWAETRKLLSRPLARFGLLFSAVLGAFGPLAVLLMANTPLELQGEAVKYDMCAANGLEWGLTVRHWSGSAQLLIAVLGALSYAGELQSHTLREDLVRPVERWVVLLAKWLSLSAWSLLALLAQGAVGGLLGLVLLGASGEQTMAHVGAAFAVSWPVELSFAAFALCSAVLVRSVSGALVVILLFVVFERAFSLISWAASGFFSDAGSISYVPFLPSTAWSVWTEMLAGATPSWQPWLALVLWTLLASSIALVGFSRTDVP